MHSGFDLPTYVDKAFEKLTADVALDSGVNIGEYQTSLSYVQPGVTIKTDKSLNLILPVLAQPIVQKIVGGSVLGIETVLIKDVKENSFGTALKGSITTRVLVRAVRICPSFCASLLTCMRSRCEDCVPTGSDDPVEWPGAG